MYTQKYEELPKIVKIILQIFLGVPVEYLKYEPRLGVKIEVPDASVPEVFDYVGLFQTYGNDVVLRQYYAEGQRIIQKCVVLRFYDRNVHEDEPLAVLVLDTHRFLFVQSGSQEIHPDIELFRDALEFFISRICEMYPAAGSDHFGIKYPSGAGIYDLDQFNSPSSCLPAGFPVSSDKSVNNRGRLCVAAGFLFFKANP